MVTSHVPAPTHPGPSKVDFVHPSAASVTKAVVTPDVQVAVKPQVQPAPQPDVHVPVIPKVQPVPQPDVHAAVVSPLPAVPDVQAAVPDIKVAVDSQVATVPTVPVHPAYVAPSKNETVHVNNATIVPFTGGAAPMASSGLRLVGAIAAVALSCAYWL
jgi:hypothetical protein